MIDGVEVKGLVGRASDLRLMLDADVLSGIGVGGLDVTSEGEGILLFDEDGDGGVDSFYLDGALLDLGDIAIGEGLLGTGEALLRAEEAQLRLSGLTTVKALLETGETLGGELQVLARRGVVAVGDGVSLSVGETEEGGGDGWGVEGVIDLGASELRLGLERVEVLVGGGDVLSLSADPVGEKDALELRVPLNGGGSESGDALWFELSGLQGELGLLGGGVGAPQVRAERVGVQRDGDVELGVLGVDVPLGYGSEWSEALGVLPVVVEGGELSFGERGDGSADWGDARMRVDGVVRLDGLRDGLRKGLDQEGLDVEWWMEKGGVWDEQEEGEALTLQLGVHGEGGWNAGGIGVVESAAQRVVIDGWRLPLPGGEVRVRGELLLAGVDGEGRWQELSGGLLPSGVSEGAQALLLLEAEGEGGGGLLRGSGGGRAVLYGDVKGDGSGGLLVRLGGSVEVRDGALDLSGLGVEVRGGYGEVELGWELAVKDGKWSGMPVVKGLSIGELSVEVKDVLRVEIGSVNWYGEAKSVVIDGVEVKGLVGRASDVDLSFLSGLLDNVSFRLPSGSNGLLVFDEDSDGTIDGFYLDQLSIAVDSLNWGPLNAEDISLDLLGLSNLDALVSDNSLFGLTGDVQIRAQQVQASLAAQTDDVELGFAPAADDPALMGSVSLEDGRFQARANNMYLRTPYLSIDGSAGWSIEPQPDGLKTTVEAFGWLDPGLVSLDNLRASAQLQFADYNLQTLRASVGATAAPQWLGGLPISGDLTFTLDIPTRKGSLSFLAELFGAELEGVASYDIDGNSFEAKLQVQAGQPLQLTDWLAIDSGSIKYIFDGADVSRGSAGAGSGTTDANTTHRLELEGTFELLLGSSRLILTGAAAGALHLRADDRELSLDDFSLDDLSITLEEDSVLQIGDFSVRVEKDGVGRLPKLALKADTSGFVPSLSAGRFVIESELAHDLAIDLPEGGIVRRNGTWQFSDFRIDLNNSSAPVDFGVVRLGTEAAIWFDPESQTLSLRPDLEINPYLYNLALMPLGAVAKTTVLPVVEPIVDVMTAPLMEKSANSNHIAILNARVDAGPLANDIGSLIALMENFPVNPYRGDGRLYFSEFLDFFVWQVYSFVKANPTLTATAIVAGLAALGVPIQPSLVAAIIGGIPFVSLSSGVAGLAAVEQLLKQLAPSDAQLALFLNQWRSDPKAFFSADQAWVDTGDFVLNLDASGFLSAASIQGDPISDVSLGGQIHQSLVNRFLRGDLNRADAPGDDIIKSLIGLSDPLDPFGLNPLSGFQPYASINANLSLPLFDDPVDSIMALLAGGNVDLLELGVNAKAGFDWNIKIPYTQPLFGFGYASDSVRIDLDLASQFVLGLSSTADRLSLFAQSLIRAFDSGVDIGAIATSFGDLLETQDLGSGPSGLYLESDTNGDLLTLSASISYYKSLVDLYITGLRAYLEMNGSLQVGFDVDAGGTRRYLDDLLQSLVLRGRIGAAAGLDWKKVGVSFDPWYAPKAYTYWDKLLRGDVTLFGFASSLQNGKPVFRPSILPGVNAGPVRHGSVLFDLRAYDPELGVLQENLNLSADQGELLVTTDGAGHYWIDERLMGDPSLFGNHDDTIDWMDGLVIAGTPRSDGRISLVDSISGVDLGFPLVGLPGGNISILTTLKYAALLRWRPDMRIGEIPLTPELITGFFGQLLQDTPLGFYDDSFSPYSALQSADQAERDEGVNTLVFSYQNLAVVKTVMELFRKLQLDFGEDPVTSAAALRLWGYQPQPNNADRLEITAFSAYGYALKQRFGASGDVNPNDRFGRAAVAEQFDITNATHLRAVLKEILGDYPLKQILLGVNGSSVPQDVATALKDVRSATEAAVVDDYLESHYGGVLDCLSVGLSRIVQTVEKRLRQSAAVGEEFVIGSISGSKRFMVEKLASDLVRLSVDGKFSDVASFERAYLPEFFTPLPLDDPARVAEYSLSLVPLISGADSESQAPSAFVEVSDQLVSPESSEATPTPVELLVRLRAITGEEQVSPDYGLSVRFRIGGTAIEGVDYALDPSLSDRTLLVPAGVSEAVLPLQLLWPASGYGGRFVDVQLLSSDSGFGVDQQQSVVHVLLPGGAQTSMDSPLRSGASTSFQASFVVRRPNSSGVLRVPASEGSNVVLEGVDGRQDLFLLSRVPEGQGLPQVRNFDPADGDKILIEPGAFSGTDIEDFNTYAGLVMNVSSATPLALISDVGAAGQDLAWSGLSSSPLAGYYRYATASELEAGRGGVVPDAVKSIGKAEIVVRGADQELEVRAGEIGLGSGASDLLKAVVPAGEEKRPVLLAGGGNSDVYSAARGGMTVIVDGGLGGRSDVVTGLDGAMSEWCWRPVGKQGDVLLTGGESGSRTRVLLIDPLGKEDHSHRIERVEIGGVRLGLVRVMKKLDDRSPMSYGDLNRRFDGAFAEILGLDGKAGRAALLDTLNANLQFVGVTE